MGQNFILGLYFIALIVLFLFGMNSYFLVFTYKRKQHKKNPTAPPLKMFPKVTVQLPVYNEYYVVERLIHSVCQLDYPRDRLEIQVLDDSTDETLEVSKRCVDFYKKQGFDITLLHRKERKGFKSGALRYGLKHASGELIAIFDADFIPPKDFLRRTVPYFQDEKVGMVQTRWGHLNHDYSLLTKAQAIGLDGHFVVEQSARYYAGFFMNFNGTAGIWRRTCIEDAGNWEDDTLTEDLDLSYRAQLHGWQFIFLKDMVCPAELPSDMRALKAQQFRWTKGAFETAKKVLPQVWRSSVPLLTKIQATLHLTNNTVFPTVLLCSILNYPLLLIKHGYNDHQTYFAISSIFVLAFLGTTLFYFFSQKDIYSNWRRRILYFPVFLAGTMGLSVNNTQAVLEGLFKKRSEFVRTPKYRIITKKDNWKNKKYHPRKLGATLFLELILAGYCFLPILEVFKHNDWSVLPFLLLFFFGYSYVAIMSLIHHYSLNPRQFLVPDQLCPAEKMASL
ncbi:glycosyl transferase family 2 [candidate division KSB1 bacterium]|nr:glycosyltransferase family 2 protein [bacterium]OQX60657.1 MAG: glycosyl transferase family 2 [candidate division KSB1 bacterium 4484_219]RKY93105.1 MAG: glycosyl transferase family 2 [candidate division KSB1 bacterium]